MSSCCPAVAGQFDREYVARELASREKKGPGKTARRLVETLTLLDIRDRTLLDIGGGLGDIQAGLFPLGLRAAAHVEVSDAYSDAARKLASEEGYADRVEFHVGDFVALSDRIPHADVVTLDRVICCYPDMPALLESSLERARSVYAFSVPKARWPSRLLVGFENLRRRLTKDPFRTYVHSTQDMDRRIRERGFEPVHDRSTFIWRVIAYRRVESTGGSGRVRSVGASGGGHSADAGSGGSTGASDGGKLS